jgi:predicted nucleic acid-binding protein
VYEEVVLFGNGRPGEQEIVQANWIQLRSLAVPLKEPFRGEDEAIALALEIQAEFVIIDEVRGYRKAKVHGLTVLRSGGLLVMAKQAGFIKRVRPILDHMIHEGFWLCSEVYQTILERVGEG